MSNQEKDRLVEIIFYLYLTRLKDKILEKNAFWEMINRICIIYNIDPMQISKASRACLDPAFAPTDEEIVYLMNKIDVSVRNLSKISGIYWQRKIAIEKELESKPIKVSSKIYDVLIKRAMKDFVNALLNINGILKYFNEEQLDKIF